MSYWQKEWQKVYGRLYDRSLYVILWGPVILAAIIGGTLYLGSYIGKNYPVDPYIIGLCEAVIIGTSIRKMCKEGGSIHNFLVYFGNKALKKMVVAYLVEVNQLRAKVAELEIRKSELSLDRQELKKRLEATGAASKSDTGEKGIASYQKLLLYYLQKYEIDYSDSNWAAMTAKAMERQGIQLSDKTLRTIRNGLLEQGKTRKDKA